MTQAVCLQVLRWSWGIEVYHRALKQCGGVERAQVRGRRAVWGHLLLALRAFVRLEVSRLRSGVSWYGLKLAIIRGAIREYLARPRYDLQPTA
jgi:putative transposase